MASNPLQLLAAYFKTVLGQQDFITLDESAFTQTGVTNSESLPGLIEGYLSLNGALEINGVQATDIPSDPTTELTISAGSCEFLNTNMNVKNLTFSVSNNILELELSTDSLVAKTGGAWNLSTSFPEIQKVKYLDGLLTAASFTFSTSYDSSTNEQTGVLGFNAQVNMTATPVVPAAQQFLSFFNGYGPIGQFLTFFNAGNPLHVLNISGTVDLKNKIQTAYSGKLPNVQISASITDSSDSIKLFDFLKVKKPRVTIRTVQFNNGITD